MRFSEEILKKANIVPLLRLAVKKENGEVVGTGPHRVRLLEDKVIKRKNPETGETEHFVVYFVEENGEKFKYSVPLKGKDGQIHYLIQRLGYLPEGTEVILEYKKRKDGEKGFIDVQEVVDISQEKTSVSSVSSEEEFPISEQENEIPVIEDEQYEE